MRMRIPEAPEKFCELMNEHYPELKSLAPHYEELEANMHDRVDNISRYLEEASQPEILIGKLMQQIISDKDPQARAHTSYEIDWALMHPTWTTKNMFGYLSYKQRGNVESFRMLSVHPLNGFSGNVKRTAMLVQTETDEYADVSIDGEVFGSKSPGHTQDQIIVASHLLAALTQYEFTHPDYWPQS